VWSVCWRSRAWSVRRLVLLCEPLLYLVAGALLAFVLGRKLLDSPARAGPVRLRSCFIRCRLGRFRPMPDLSEGVLGAAVDGDVVDADEPGRRTAAWMIAVGVLVYAVGSNRVTGAFVVPVLIVCTLAFFRGALAGSWAAGAVAAACYGVRQCFTTASSGVAAQHPC